MRFKDQFCPPKLANRLRDLGVLQRSVFAYRHSDGELIYNLHFEHNTWTRYTAAFSVAELSVMLPNDSVSWYNGEFWHSSDRYDTSRLFFVGETEAFVKAFDLISRIEAKEISVEEVNQRLILA